MPVSFLPLITWLAIFAFLIANASRGKKPFWKATVACVVLVMLIVLAVYGPGWLLWARASNGDPASQYEYARWTENHSEQINAVLLWPAFPDVLGGYRWLQKSADQEYPPALFAIGVRLKYGIHVPQPADWNGPGGNVFPQPDRGQHFIDRAHELGYKEPTDEESFYWQHYRR